MNAARSVAIAAAFTLATAAAHAGRSCENKPPKADAIQRSMQLAEHTANTLDQSGAQVVALARIGQNLSEYGVRYSHFGLAYRDNGKWRVVHKLNQCGTAHAAVYRQGLGEFFLDDLYEYEAAVVIPTPEIQARLLPVLRDNARLAQLNTPAYSMVAYPWSTRYQQSNQWALETLAGSLDPAASTRERAQSWLQLHDYQPTVLHLDAFTRLGARMTRANVAFDDHPNSKRFSDHIETVTVESMFAWMQRMHIAGQATVVR